VLPELGVDAAWISRLRASYWYAMVSPETASFACVILPLFWLAK
jgi:hypothetical protein